MAAPSQKEGGELSAGDSTPLSAEFGAHIRGIFPCDAMDVGGGGGNNFSTEHFQQQCRVARRRAEERQHVCLHNALTYDCVRAGMILKAEPSDYGGSNEILIFFLRIVKLYE